MLAVRFGVEHCTSLVGAVFCFHKRRRLSVRVTSEICKPFVFERERAPCDQAIPDREHYCGATDGEPNAGSRWFSEFAETRACDRSTW